MKLYVDSIHYHLQIEQSDSSLPYLLMFHGFMGSGSNFTHLMKPLSGFCNPITIDLLGHGKSARCTEPQRYNSKEQVTHLRSILQRLKIQNPFIYGYSMGGRLAFQLLNHSTDDIKGAIIESSHCGLSDETDRLERMRTDESLAKNIEVDFESFITQWTQLPLFASTPDHFKQLYENTMNTQDRESMAASLRGFGSGVMPPVCDEIKNLDIPIHLVAGEKDQKYSRLMEQISTTNSNFTFESIPKAGHRVHTDQPELLIQSIHKLLTR